MIIALTRSIVIEFTRWTFAAFATENKMTSVVGCKTGNRLSCILGGAVVPKQPNLPKNIKKAKSTSTNKFGNEDNWANNDKCCSLQMEKKLLSCFSGRAKYIGHLLIYHRIYWAIYYWVIYYWVIYSQIYGVSADISSQIYWIYWASADISSCVTTFALLLQTDFGLKNKITQMSVWINSN